MVRDSFSSKPHTTHHNTHTHTQESHNLYVDKVPIGLKSLKHRHDIVFSQAVTTVATSFVFKLTQSMAVSSFLAQLIEVGYLMHWESLLSTMGDELGMLEDFIVAIHDLNNVKFKVCALEVPTYSTIGDVLCILHVSVAMLGREPE